MFSQNNNGFSADLLKAVRQATAKGPAPRNPREVEEAMKKADEPAAPNQAAIERRKRLQAIQDRKDDAGRGKKAEMKTSMRKVAGTAYGGSNQKDDSSDDMNEELFTDAELEAISTAATKL